MRLLHINKSQSTYQVADRPKGQVASERIFHSDAPEVLAREGFTPFFQEEYLRIVLYLRKNGASEAEAEDAVQEAMTDAYRLWNRIESPRPWVHKAAFRAYLRDRSRVRRQTPVPSDELVVSNNTGTTDEDDQDEQWRVIAVMRQLPPEQRKVAALFYDGLSLAEIADVVGKPTSTVRSLLRHARTRLKEVVLSEGVDSPGTTP